MNKPPYKVPSMEEINALPWNGYNVVSTFSGCGGSCLGFKMAGFRVLWANEFIPAAQDTYRANHKSTILDTRDIRKVQAQDILDQIRLKKGELDVFEGSPPCASFSTAGKREVGWGKVKKYSDSCQRTDDLFFEYARLLKDLQPKVFIAENVSGLVKGTAKGYFLLILKALKDCGYDVAAKVLDAQWLGVPQARQRLIFIGVRKDLGVKPSHPKPLDYQYTVRDALEGVLLDGHRCYLSPKMAIWYKETPQGSSISKGSLKITGKEMGYNHVRSCWTKAAPTICQTSPEVYHPDIPGSFTIPELKRIGSFPNDFNLTGSYERQWERIGRAVPPIMMSKIAETIRDEILCKIK
jgi:DNA (cytosine-5)-methyltransferase 1